MGKQLRKEDITPLDITADLLGNDSSVDGDSIKDALNWLKANSGGADAFTELTDTPASYAPGDALKLIRVNTGSTGLEFVIPPVHTFVGLGDTPSDYTGAALKLVSVNAGGTGLEFRDPNNAFEPTGTTTLYAPDNGVKAVSFVSPQPDVNYRIIAMGDMAGPPSIKNKTVNGFEIHASSELWLGNVDWALTRKGDTGDPDKDGTATIVTAGIVAVVFSVAYPDNNYKAFATPSMTTGLSAKNKTASGFEIHASSGAVTGDVDWFTSYAS